MGLLRLCRLCALDTESLINIYEEKGENLNLRMKIARCLHIVLSPDDLLPKMVCFDCCAKLDQSFDFLEMSSRTQLSLELICSPPKVKMEPSNDIVRQADIDSEVPLLACAGQVECPGSSHVTRTASLVIGGTNDGESNNSNKYVTFVRSDSDSKDSDDPLENLLNCILAAKQDQLLSRAKQDKEPSKDDCHNKSKQRRSSSYVPKMPRKKSELEGYEWQCADCTDVLPTLAGMVEHYHTKHSKAPNFRCAQCGKVLNRYIGLKRHLKLHRQPRRFNCRQCDAEFTERNALLVHRTSHTGAKLFSCPQCRNMYTEKHTLCKHIRTHHLPRDQSRFKLDLPPDPKFTCDICNKQVSKKETLKSHLKIHVGERDFICDQCGKAFVTFARLKYHILTHSATRSFVCGVCNMGFYTSAALSTHLPVHNATRYHQCEVCGKQFRKQCNLRVHMIVHTEERPFVCEFCDKGFRVKCHLKVHRRVHTGERPYDCGHCPRRFASRTEYNRHNKRVHKINASHRMYLQKLGDSTKPALGEAKIHNTRSDPFSLDDSKNINYVAPPQITTTINHSLASPVLADVICNRTSNSTNTAANSSQNTISS
uniref:Uncharacterized protein n=1 Tax=Timema monikensis TaxID=170555 RepID=A0A7R9HR21_9NEOP|nr:unnamed protein product [Timema monikensis]